MTPARYHLHVVTGDTETGPVVAAVTGEVDVTNAEDFVMAAEKLPGARPVVLDLGQLTYLDSAGHAVLDRLTATNTAVVVIPSASPLARAADLMDLARHETVDQAVAAIGAGERA